MPLTDMKLSKKEAKERDKPQSISSKRKYPWGLEITLEKESLKKLKFDLSKFKVGQKVTILCKAEVSRLSESESYDEDDKSISFQIQWIAIKGTKKDYSLGWDASDKDVNEQLKKDGLLS